MPMELALLLTLGIILVIAGIAGLAFPAMPGAPLVFAGLFVIAWAEDFTYVGSGTLIVLAVLAALTYVVDFVAGAFGVRRFGASPRAMAGAAIGAIAGLFFGLPGIVLGPFIGAALGELTVTRRISTAGWAGIGATVGLIIGVAAKIALAFAMIGVFVFMRVT